MFTKSPRRVPDICAVANVACGNDGTAECESSAADGTAAV